VAYQRILQLTYVEDLLAALKSLFIKLFEPFLATFVASLHAVNSGKLSSELTASWNFSKAFEGWDKVFDKLLRGLEDKAAQASFSLSLLSKSDLSSQERKSRLRPAVVPAVANSSPPSDDTSTGAINCINQEL
jgi:signal recognition particle receptor subunit alpha